ncbi:MAG: class IV adenylate cyclase [Thermoplasmata archaeon]
MIEVEAKARVTDVRAILRSLKKMGAKEAEETVQTDTYYSHPSRRFEMSDEALRVRASRKGVSIAYKGPKLDRRSKSREEVELAVSSASTARALLLRLGFKPVGVVRKRRRIFRVRGLKVCLDRVEGLGVFLEVEKKVDERRYASTLEKVLGLLRQLGLDKTERRSYLELILAPRAQENSKVAGISSRGSLSSRRQTLLSLGRRVS